MKALTWHGKRDVRIDDHPDPAIEDPTDAIIRMTTTAICGSDLHLYEVLGPFIEEGSILGHEPMGVVEEVGSEVSELSPGDRVVIPFQISCGSCFMCDQGLQTQCETTQVREEGMGAMLFGYTKLYGSQPGGQAEYCACRRPTTRTSRWRTGRRTSASSTSRTSCRRRGRRSSTPACRTAAASRCSGSAPSATWRAGSRTTAATG